MGFWKSVSKALNPKTAGQFISGSKSDSNVINQIVGGIRKTSPDMVDRKIANVTADELGKTPLGEKDPLLAKQKKDTDGNAVEPNQLRSQLRVGATIAAVVYTAGAASGSVSGGVAGSEAGSSLYGAGEGLAAANSFDSGAMAASLGYSAPTSTTGAWISGAGATLKTAQGYIGTAAQAASLYKMADAALNPQEKAAAAASQNRGAILLPDGRYVENPTLKERETIIESGGMNTDILPLLAIAGATLFALKG